ncbi:MAG: hypothetical protein JRI68_03200 [Deltaproteobacteria bacterium]|nr:hypothetical protein [Deltaproteobacteria bacterium]
MRGWTTLAILASLLCPRTADAQERFALQLFHFNVQYVCGGTLGFVTNPNPVLDLDNDALEDRIITESFEPVIDLFAKHPTWGVDLEMQAYMLDVIAWRHPELLEKMRSLAQSGQIDILSFHYSDQLFIGYPQLAWERSQALTEEVFARHGIPLSRTVFCQEGQSAAAMADHFASRGYRTMVWPKNLWSFQHGDFEAEPLYHFGDGLMVAGAKGIDYDQGGTQIEVSWTFFDDGELLATGDFDPYFPEFFWEDEEAVAAYEAKLENLESQGYRIATVDQYVTAVEQLVTPTDPPPLLDGTWQPGSTVGVKRWLGGAGLWRHQERDNHVRTLGAIAHRELVAAETMAAAAGLDASAELDAAWRLLFLGQVTDATGINPFRGEIQYGIAHMAEATRIAREVIIDGKQTLSLSTALIDPAAGTVTEGEGPWLTGAPAKAPLVIEIDGGDRAVSEQWEAIGEGHWRVAVTFGPGDPSVVSVRFPGELEDGLALSLALADDSLRTLSRSAFDFESFHLALPTGAIGLGGGRFVVKDLGRVHLAAEIWRDDGDVLFQDETAALEETHTWVFHVLDGTAAQAAQLARDLNVERRLAR